jgi:hypothetical protein
MKIYDDTMELNRKNSGDPLGGCQSHFWLPHAHAWGQGLCWTSPGSLIDFFSDIEQHDPFNTLLPVPLPEPRPGASSFLTF